ncbi:class I SAM-dependent methyltransferase [Aquihabitans sp. G128]|uniref:class I SAM-dependent methyltransferase n=1 Tax=Aquihabitans sp. G128 TaxID=2849779 RepID=UPI001C23D7E1|nr:class I SAM-dependent methyltransferase [Aquihabitans sp. G128]QXC59510.1 class I SAM-dependent methyltransferase [Aquihabitans sp. G128]
MPAAPVPDAQAWFDRWVDTYDAERRILLPSFDLFYGTTAEAAALGRSGPVRVLDLGAGTGLLSGTLAAALPEASFVLVDEAPAMLEKAQERLAPLEDRVRTLVADLRDPLPEGGFDVIASALAIHHLADDEKADLYRRASEALRPGGVLLNAEQVAGPTAALDVAYRERWDAHTRALGATDATLAAAAERMSIDRPASVEDQLAMFRAAGLVQVDCLFKHWRFAVLAGWKPPV